MNIRKISRRRFLKEGITVTAAYALPFVAPVTASEYVMTVNGPVPLQNLGFTLSHEHIMVDFAGADKVSRLSYKEEEVYQRALPVLMSVKEKGCNAITECTASYLGRDVQLLRRLASASGLHIITNTGYYGAAKEKHVPAHAYRESASQLAARWIAEWKNGIEDSGIKPGFIKSGVDNYPLSPLQQKLVEAAAITHLETGLTIGIHTGDGK
ncbi:MAG: phosphotriesterase, partial [Sphingobacteriales bacterium]